jgi:diguanylate cyclase (GGDEF)-like protein/PAS domain S-box-containing protein
MREILHENQGADSADGMENGAASNGAAPPTTPPDSASAPPAPPDLLALLEKEGDGIVRFDAEWHYTYISESAAQLFGVPAAALLGRRFAADEGVAVGEWGAEEGTTSASDTPPPTPHSDRLNPFGTRFESRCLPEPGGGMVVIFRSVAFTTVGPLDAPYPHFSGYPAPVEAYSVGGEGRYSSYRSYGRYGGYATLSDISDDGFALLGEEEFEGATEDAPFASTYALSADPLDPLALLELPLRDESWLAERVAATTPDLMTVFDVRARRIVYANRDMAEWLGYGRREVDNLSIDFLRGVIHPEDFEGLVTAHDALYDMPDGAVTEATYRVLLRGGAIRTLRARLTLFARDRQGYPTQTLAVAQDVTEALALREALERTTLFAERIAHALPDLLYVWDIQEDRVAYTNRKLSAMLGYNAQERERLFPRVFETLMHPEDMPEFQAHRARLFRAEDGEIWEFETRLLHRDGVYRWFHYRESILTREDDGRPRQIMGVAQNITERKALEQEQQRLRIEAEQRAERDALTGLYGHQAYHSRLIEEGERAARESRPLAVVVLDVDNFKYFNDAYGHPDGDRVLRQVATTLRRTCRAYDIVGRLGGDEFALALPGLSRADAETRLAAGLAASDLSVGFTPTGHEHPVPLRVSFGVAVYPDEADSPLATLRLADKRLYENKRHNAGGLNVLRADLRADLTGFALLDGLVTAVDVRDRYTRRHSEDVLIHSLNIGTALGLSAEEMDTLKIAALLHNVGMIGVPDRLLRMPKKLSSTEVEEVRQHATLGAMLVEVCLGLPRVTAAVRHHHENWDGTGYPDGLKGEEIPYLSRILAVADAYAALTSDRPYRASRRPTDALETLRKGSGRQWDPACIAAFLIARTGGRR